MATVGRETSDDNAPLADTVREVLGSIAITTQPVVIMGVNRKVNIGNFENIDVYMGLALPLPGVSVDDMELLTAVVERVVEEGMKLAAGETFKRYDAIKEMANG